MLTFHPSLSHHPLSGPLSGRGTTHHGRPAPLRAPQGRPALPPEVGLPRRAGLGRCLRARRGHGGSGGPRRSAAPPALASLRPGRRVSSLPPVPGMRPNPAPRPKPRLSLHYHLPGKRCEERGPRLLRRDRGTVAGDGRGIHLVHPRRRRRQLPSGRGSFLWRASSRRRSPTVTAPEPAPSARGLPAARPAPARPPSAGAAAPPPRGKREPGDVAAGLAIGSASAAFSRTFGRNLTNAGREPDRAEQKGNISRDATQQRRAVDFLVRQPPPSPPTHAHPHRWLLLGPSPQIYDS